MKYRLSFYPAFEKTGIGGQKDSFMREYTTLALAREHLNLIADYTLFLHGAEIMPDYSNSGFIEVWDDCEWVEVE